MEKYQPSANVLVKNAISAIDQYLDDKITAEYMNSIKNINRIWNQKGFNFSYYIDELNKIINSFKGPITNSQQLNGLNDVINSYTVAFVNERIKPRLKTAIQKEGTNPNVVNSLIAETIKELNNAKKTNLQTLKNIK